MEDKISIGIVDDHSLFRSGLVLLLEEFPEILVSFEASNGLEMQAKFKVLTALPKLILMDINMPEMDGYLSTKWLRDNYPEIKVLALSMYDSEEVIIKMIRAGANGFIVKESKPSEVFYAIQYLQKNQFYTNEIVSGRIIKTALNDELENKPDLSLLNEREILFLKECCSDLSYRQIADKLNLSPFTINNYREDLFKKLNIKSRTGLVIYAIKNQYYFVA